MSENNDQKSREVKEILAFAAANLGTRVGSQALEAWQADIKTRQAARNNATLLLERLEAMGLKLQIKSAKKIDESIEYLRTVQPKEAYKLDEAAMVYAAPQPLPETKA